MSIRSTAEDFDLNVKQRLTLFNGTSLKTQDFLQRPIEDITFEFLIAHGVRSINITASGLRPLQLQKMGVDNASRLKQLGFDALYFVDSIFAEEAVACFGSDDVVATFLIDPADAVCLAGTEACHLLNITTEMLLKICCGYPIEAMAVLKQQKTPKLRSVNGLTLLDCGVRAKQLTQLGITVDEVKTLHFAKVEDFKKLMGY